MRKLVILLIFSLMFTTEADAQKWLKKLGNVAKEAAKNVVERRVEDKAEEVTEQALDKAEDSVTKDRKSEKTKSDDEEGDEAIVEEESREEADGSTPQSSSQVTTQKLTSTSQYDFVAGDQILFFEDFSQDAIGDIPALWTSNSGGEVKRVNIAPGNWLHMNQDAVYCYLPQIKFPENFIVEFDIIPDEKFDYGIQFTLYQESKDNPLEMNDDLFPGEAGLHIVARHEVWETNGYKGREEWISGQATKNMVVREQENHVIIWIQKRRLRIYHQNAKVIDMPTNIYPDVTFNRMRFSVWDRYSTPFVSNIKITTASPDIRTKMITEGRLVTYGITFDLNKADVKPESFGTLKSIADVLKENESVRFKIIGHTASDEDDANNLELSRLRSASVKNELVSLFGIDVSRIETEGAGDTAPVAPNDTPANKALNRRVEFVRLP